MLFRSACRRSFLKITSTLSQPPTTQPSEPVEVVVANTVTTTVPTQVVEKEWRRRDNITKKVLQSLLSECDYFEVIKEETPMVFDIAAIQYIYGANNNYKTGDDTYTFDPTKPFFKTIWDAGGKDTISVSNFSLSCDVDLTPGNYSSLRYPKPADAGGATPTSPPHRPCRVTRCP